MEIKCLYVPWEFVDLAESQRGTVFKIIIVILIVIEYRHINLVILVTFAVIGIVLTLHKC
jgi:hypothetical protein